MNEITNVPSKSVKQNFFNANILFALAIFFIFRNAIPQNKISKSLNFNNINLLNILRSLDIQQIRNKIDILIKTGPYLPDNVVTTLNNIVPIYEKVNAIIYLIEFLKSSNSSSIIEANSNLTQQEKISHIVKILNKEIPNKTLKNITPFIEIALNIDKYKDIIKVIPLLANSDNKENQFEKISEVLSPLFKSSNSNQNLPILDILKVLSSDDNNKS